MLISDVIRQMKISFRSANDAMLTYCTIFSIYITFWKVEKQTDTVMLVLYYCDFVYIGQYVASKILHWLAYNTIDEHNTIDNTEEISLEESFYMFTTPLSLLPFHTIYKLEMDGGFLYQLICLTRLYVLYQQKRIKINFGEQQNVANQGVELESNRGTRNISKTEKRCQCWCTFAETSKDRRN